MPALAQVHIDPSQFPDNVRRDLLASLRDRRINHKFHYDSYKQTRKWLALHSAYSPSRTEDDCAAIYDRCFAATAANVDQTAVHLIGLGCGGGQKDTRLIRLLRDAGKEVLYTPVDVSVAMVLVARQTALSVIKEDACFPLVCDLATTENLTETLAKPDAVSRITQHAARIITCFGMLPNFDPKAFLHQLAGLVGPKDVLLLSANLAPGSDYRAGVQRILPQYDNALTRDWLMTFLRDLGVEDEDGEIRFVVEGTPAADNPLRVVSQFQFRRERFIEVDSERFDFRIGDTLRLFFSYRYTPELVRALLAACSLKVRDQWIAGSGEEGVFMIDKE